MIRDAGGRGSNLHFPESISNFDSAHFDLRNAATVLDCCRANLEACKRVNSLQVPM